MSGTSKVAHSPRERRKAWSRSPRALRLRSKWPTNMAMSARSSTTLSHGTQTRSGLQSPSATGPSR